MSLELNYFPPNRMKFKWAPKSYNNSPWFCNILEQKLPKIGIRDPWPASVTASVNLKNAKYIWSVNVCDWDNKVYVLEGSSDYALEACRQAERAAEKEIKKLFPAWVVKALKSDWRPPWRGK